MVEFPFDRIEREMDLALLVDFGDKKIWLPKSEVDYRAWSKIIGVKAWLAERKGLV
jgi:hypothetical protein